MLRARLAYLSVLRVSSTLISAGLMQAGGKKNWKFKIRIIIYIILDFYMAMWYK